MPSKLWENTMSRRFAPRQHLSISLNVKLGGVCLKISERNWLGSAGGIPPHAPLPPAAPVRLWRRSDTFGLDDFKFFFGGKFFSLFLFPQFFERSSNFWRNLLIS
jgi:hypothetical protein